MTIDANRSRALLVEHVRRALVHHLGARQVDVWLGKDGVHEHSMTELAEIAVDALDAVLAVPDVPARVERMHTAGDLAPPIDVDPHDW